MISFPHSKINLGLYIVRKRPDGYHDISTCFFPIPLTDALEVIPSREFSFTSSGRSIPGNATENLCVRAYNLIREHYKVPPVKIHLHKVIPMGAGLGGGSSDGAFTIRMLNVLFDLKLSSEHLKGYASMLGSDCSFFIEDTPKIGRGKGELLEEVGVHLKGKFLVLVKPDVHVSTATAYAGTAPMNQDVDVRNLIAYPVQEWKSVLKNQFEDSVLIQYPEIKKIKETLYELGAIYASMSGSGASVFGLFDRPVSIRSKFEGQFYWSTTL